MGVVWGESGLSDNGPPIKRANSKPQIASLAIDAMGGDNAPESVLAGVDLSAERHPGAKFLLVGDEARILPMLDAYPRAKKSCLSLPMRPGSSVLPPSSTEPFPR